MSLFNRPMRERERRRWERMRRHGKWMYVLIWGVLAWGLPVAIACSVMMELWDANWSLQAWDTDRFAIKLAVALLGFPAGGVLYGLILWHLNEGRCRR